MKLEKCAIPTCDNEARFLYLGKMICGECLVKIYSKNQEKQWEEIINGSN